MLHQIKINTVKLLLSSFLPLSLSGVAQMTQSDSSVQFKRTSWLTDNGRSSVLDLLVDSMLRTYMQSPENCGLSIGISTNGKDYFYNYGETQRKSTILPGNQTIYEIGSLSSTFCGLLLAQAIIEKRIKAEDDVRKYLQGNYPDLEFNKSPVLIKHLANHSGGLPSVPDDLLRQEGYDPLNPYASYTREKLFNYLKTIKPASRPGSVCDYSNVGMALLGVILEEVYHKSFEELVKEKISLPAELTNTAVNLDELQTRQFLTGYNAEGELTPHWNLGAFQSAGGLKSTTGDMLRYLHYNMEEKTDAVKLTHQITFTSRQQVGLAWFIKKTKLGNSLFWHNGATFGFSCFNGFIKEKKCSVVILANASRNVDYIGIAILNYLQK